MEIRTDLALENKEGLRLDSVSGISVAESKDEATNTKITKVKITTKNGMKLMNKPIGDYITLEIPKLSEEDDSFQEKIAQLIANEIRLILADTKLPTLYSILLIGLGNRDVTSDSLGPKVMDHLHITRHLFKQYGSYPNISDLRHSISCISPDVMAKTGMESGEITKGIILETKPDLLIAVDALAARSVKRLYSTVQISNTGIHPGSGVGNHRLELSQETMGIPVLAIGIPTVVDAATIVSDFLKEVNGTNTLPTFSQFDQEMTTLQNMYVTGKDIDSIVERLSLTLALGLNLAFS